MKFKLGVVMDPPGKLKLATDTTVALMAVAQAQGWEVYYLAPQKLCLQGGQPTGLAFKLTLNLDQELWYSLGEAQNLNLSEFKIILLRKDPPFDQHYLHLTYILDLASRYGCKVINDPLGVMRANEKIFATWFPHCMPETLVSADKDKINEFIQEFQDVILKPLDAMGGRGIFRLKIGDPNIAVAVETMTQNGDKLVMLQRYLPEIVAGDKRILLLNGEPLPWVLKRLPPAGSSRANISAGGVGIGAELSARDHWICREIAPRLREWGLFLVGIDVIGDYLTEINVTSPTGVRELESMFKINIGQQIFDQMLENYV